MVADLTLQQRRAVEHRGTSVVLTSGAGCGKTHVLTARYLSHLRMDQAAVGEVVAITFTERAAREMRGRIRERVAGELARCSPGSDGHARWRKHLRDLELAPINTIHGFCTSLLRQYAADAGIDPQFEVLDDTLSASLRTESLKAALHGLLTEESPVGEELRELVVLFGYSAVREAVDAFLLAPDPPAWEKWLSQSPNAIAAGWLSTDRRRILPEYVAYLRFSSPELAAGLIDLDRIEAPTEDSRRHRAAVRDELQRVLSGDPNADAQSLRQLATIGSSHAKVKKAWGEENYPTVKAAFEAIRGLCDQLSPLLGDHRLVPEAAVVGQRFIRVAQVACAAYRDRKRRASAADFHDLLTLARDLLRDRPAVQSALRKRYRFVLLDELQDTDPVQMELVELLCGAGVQYGTLFAVGDVKQSIYRFRGAEVDLFRNLRTGVPLDGRMDLTRNYRSQPGVIGFVNALCGPWFPDEAGLEAHREGVGGGGNVEFLWAVPAGRTRSVSDGVKANPVADAPGSPETVAQIRAREAEAIARRIVELLADPTPRVGDVNGPRRVEAKDVVLLFRSMTNVATYEAALRRHGLDYYLVGGRAFFAQQEVYDLLNLLRAVENPHDGLSLAGALRSPFCNLSDEALHLVGTHPEGVWAGLFDPDRFAELPADQKPAVERARRILTAWRSVKDDLPIARLINRIFADSGYDAATQFEFLGDRKLANLWKLVDLARDFDRTGYGLPEFIAQLADQVARQPREEQAATQPENADVVKLMSVHQAKGLEFPVVFVPDLGAAGRGSISPVARWDRGLGCLTRLPTDVLDDEREAGNVPFSEFPDRLGRAADQVADWRESLRILYVACTRARDLLVLSAGLPEAFPPGLPTRPPARSASHWMLALADRFDLRTGECLSGGEAARATVRAVDSIAECRVQSAESKSEAEPRLPSIHSALCTLHSALPDVVSLPVLERFVRGESVASIADGHACGREWVGLRDHLDPLSPVEAAFWSTVRRWDLTDPDGWAAPLTEHVAELPDPLLANRLSDDLKPVFGRFAGSKTLRVLASADECHWDLEFLLDLRAVAASADSLLDPDRGPLPVLRGLIDVLYRDAAGWHLLGIHLRETSGHDPWSDRQPGLAAAAWTVRAELGESPRSVGLLDLVAGAVRVEPVKKLRFPACFAELVSWMNRWAASQYRPGALAGCQLTPLPPSE